mmetsp:Transcript_7160/g.20182  ORF Transcript_7160/g.20182 Transcript_7160/m.20182 type:complete len:204 (-) Transcript_7160:480-1091(-)
MSLLKSIFLSTTWLSRWVISDTSCVTHSLSLGKPCSTSWSTALGSSRTTHGSAASGAARSVPSCLRSMPRTAASPRAVPGCTGCVLRSSSHMAMPSRSRHKQDSGSRALSVLSASVGCGECGSWPPPGWLRLLVTRESPARSLWRSAGVPQITSPGRTTRVSRQSRTAASSPSEALRRKPTASRRKLPLPGSCPRRFSAASPR